MTTAVIVHRFGPYHISRLRAANARGHVVGIELSATTNEYAWAPVQSDEFQRVTLSENDEAIGPRELAGKLVEAFDRIQPDTVFINGWSGNIPPVALLWSYRNKRRVVLMSESSRGDERRMPVSEWVKRRIVRCFSAALVGGRRHTDYAADLGVPRTNIFPGYDAVDNDYFSSSAEAARANETMVRTRFDLPVNYFLASNRFIPKKNLATLIAAYDLYRRRAGTGAWDLVLLGDGPLRGELVRQIEEIGLGANVHLPGFRQYDELPSYYALAGGFVHASTSEQWGLVVNEALASGLPTIVSNACGCAPELIVEGVNGWLFDPHSSEELADKMMKLAGLGPQAGEFARAGRRIVEEFGPERFADGFWKAVAVARQPVLSPTSRLVLSARTRG